MDIELKRTIPEKVMKILKGHLYYLTGSSVFYPSDGQAPQDLDICVEANPTKDIRNGLISLGFKSFDPYAFSWGGITYERYRNDKLDIFVVNSNTFNAIMHTTRVMVSMPSEPIRDKDTRIAVFEAVAKFYLKRIRKIKSQASEAAKPETP